MPRILLVEDNPDDVELTLRAFRKHGLAGEIAVAHDGVEALEWLTGARELPDLVLLDLKLPRLDGLGVLRGMRADARTRLIPVVILTSSTEDIDRLQSYQLGANSYVQKPVQFGDFVDAAHQLGVYWLELNLTAPSS
jgi:two-component system response regulator